MNGIRYDGKKILVEIDVSSMSKQDKWFLDCWIQDGADLKIGNHRFDMFLSDEERKAAKERVYNNIPLECGSE